MRRWAWLVLGAALWSVRATAQAPVPVTFAWDMPAGDPAPTAEIDRNGTATPCVVGVVSATERRCTVAVPSGAATFRVRAFSTSGSPGPWSGTLSATIPAGAAPGTFTLRWHGEIQRSTMATLRTQATGYEGADASGVSVQAGDLIVVSLRERDGSAMSVSDSVNGAYTQAVTRAAIVARTGVWYFQNSAAGTLNFTVTGGSVRDYDVSVWSGMQTASVLDTTNNAGTSGSTSHAHGSVTPSASVLLITALGSGDHGGITPDTGFTALNINGLATGNRQYYAYKLAHTGTLNPTHTSTNSTQSDAVVAAFLESAGGGTRKVIIGPKP